MSGGRQPPAGGPPRIRRRDGGGGSPPGEGDHQYYSLVRGHRSGTTCLHESGRNTEQIARDVDNATLRLCRGSVAASHRPISHSASRPLSAVALPLRTLPGGLPLCAALYVYIYVFDMPINLLCLLGVLRLWSSRKLFGMAGGPRSLPWRVDSASAEGGSEGGRRLPEPYKDIDDYGRSNVSRVGSLGNSS